MVEGAVRAKEALQHYDAGMILGPARADTWRIEEKWNGAAEILTAKLKPDHFTWNEATNFWSSTSKVDGWHVELTDENKHKMATWLTDAAEFIYIPFLLRLAMGNQRRDGDIVSDVATEKVNLNHLACKCKRIGPVPKKGRSLQRPTRRGPESKAQSRNANRA